MHTASCKVCCSNCARAPTACLLTILPLPPLLCLQVAIMSEIGWHIEQDWYYKEEYNILNMGFYFFLCSGLSAWAFGLRLNAGAWAASASAVTETGQGPEAAPCPVISTTVRPHLQATQYEISWLFSSLPSPFVFNAANCRQVMIPCTQLPTSQVCYACTPLSAPAGSDAVTPSTAFLEAPKAAATPQPPATSSTPAAAPAAGFNLGNAADTFLLAVPALTVALYGLAAAQIHTKVPIYIEMSAIFVALTYRFWQVRRPSSR